MTEDSKDEEQAGNLLRVRIRERLDALGMTVSDASIAAKGNKSFLTDLMGKSGKKNSISPSSYSALAEVLECDVDYLSGVQEVPRLSDRKLIPIRGFCEAEVWRHRPRIRKPFGAADIALDPRFSPSRQVVYQVRGSHADWIGLAHDDYLVTLASGAIAEGDTIIFRRRRGRSEETTARRVEGDYARTEVSQDALSDGEVVGRVLLSIRHH